MLQMDAMALGDYGTNCYIVRDSDSKTCCIIDPGYQPQRVLDRVAELGLEVEAILLTHGHFDHVGGVAFIAADTDCDVYINAEDLQLPPRLTDGRIYYTRTYAQGDVLQLAGLTIQVMSTPGHTPGSVCLCIEDHLFSGDTLFAGSCGRTDLPGGDWMTICESLKRLSQMEGNWTVHPGHGESTALDAERKYNPYMREYI